MKLNEFYTKVLENLGLETDDEGFIYIKTSDDNQLMLMNGLPLVLPTKDHISTLLKVTKDSFEQVKMLYNPLDENVVKGDNKSLIKTKSIVEARIGYGIMVAGRLLLTLASNKELQKDVNLELTKFLSSLSEVRKPNMKEIVDDKTINMWSDLYSNSVNAERSMISIFLKKAATYGDVKYNRLATLKSNLYEDILVATQDTPVYNIKLRNKDIALYKIVFEYLLQDLDENHVISIGSNDSFSPAFISLMKLYIKVTSRVNSIIEMLKPIDIELVESSHIDITLTDGELDMVNMFSSELKSIPTGTDIQKQLTKADQGTVAPTNTFTSVPTMATPAYIEQPLPYTPVETNDEDKVLSMLRGGNNVIGMGVTATTVIGYPSAMQQPVIGINNIPQPVVGFQPQPMYQQPVIGIGMGMYR